VDSGQTATYYYDSLNRASTTDPEAHVMRNGDGGTVPSYNVQLLTDTARGLVVNIEATTDAIDYRQADAALKRCQGPSRHRRRHISIDIHSSPPHLWESVALHGVPSAACRHGGNG
jgi:hypothetical protein